MRSPAPDLGEYAVVRYGPPDADLVIDLMTRVGTLRRPGDPRVLRVAASLLAFAVKHGLVSPIKGVRRYRALAEADRNRSASGLGA